MAVGERSLADESFLLGSPVEMHSAVNVVGSCGVLVFVRDLARGALRKVSSKKSISREDWDVVLSRSL